MKKTIKLVSLLLGVIAVSTLFFFTTSRESKKAGKLIDTNILQIIKEGFGDGDMAKIAPYFSDEITVNLLEEGDIYDAEEAKTLLVDFFQNYTIENFTVKHSGSNKSGSEQYLIGILKTKAQGIFRVYVAIKGEEILNIEIAVEELPLS